MEDGAAKKGFRFRLITKRGLVRLLALGCVALVLGVWGYLAMIRMPGWSDHWSFWQIGVEAVMVTGTATFRNPHYHQPTDTPDTLDYERFARVVDGLVPVIEAVATPEP